MSWWSRLFGGKSDGELKPQRLDYLNEALVLERQGDYDAALTSYRLALRDARTTRDSPEHGDRVLENGSSGRSNAVLSERPGARSQSCREPTMASRSC